MATKKTTKKSREEVHDKEVHGEEAKQGINGKKARHQGDGEKGQQKVNKNSDGQLHSA